VKIDLDGNKVLPSPWEANPAGFVIHSAIHANRADAHCIMHTHTTTGMAVACMEQGLQNDNFYTAMLMDDIAYHDFEGITTELGERERLVASLGDKNLLILRNHGLLSCGSTIANAFFDLWRLQRACDVHFAALNSGQPIIPISEAAVRQSVESTSRQQQRYNTPQLVFDALVRMVDSQDTSYQD
jgi:ribulose-5-phosphate 4-epimerase/fuculose-1-phosphate aldolase